MRKTKEKKKTPEPKIAIGIFQGDIKTFLEKFKSDVTKKREAYQVYRQKFSKKERR